MRSALKYANNTPIMLNKYISSVKGRDCSNTNRIVKQGNTSAGGRCNNNNNMTSKTSFTLYNQDVSLPTRPFRSQVSDPECVMHPSASS